VACRKRYVEELGRPHKLLRVGSVGGGYTAIEARKGKPGHGTMLEPNLRCGKRVRQAEKYCKKGKPAVCVWGVVSRIVLGGGESPLHGEGLDGSTKSAKETCAGHCRIGGTQANLTAGNSKQRVVGDGYELRGSECDRGTGCGKTARPGLCGGRRVTGVPTAATQ
jgi:hypothetical protein